VPKERKYVGEKKKLLLIGEEVANHPLRPSTVTVSMKHMLGFMS
jgi:hypothetical protein